MPSQGLQLKAVTVIRLSLPGAAMSISNPHFLPTLEDLAVCLFENTLHFYKQLWREATGV